MMVFKLILFVVLLVFSLLFAYYNMQEVRVSFFRYSTELPLFLALLASLVLGFILSYFATGLKLMGMRKYGERLKRGLLGLWEGRFSEAEGELSKLLDAEEVVPLYFRALRELGREPSVYLQRYSLGIVETELAGTLYKRDILRAKDLLEKALGKNWGNLNARRMLRSIYFLEGELEKALDMQRSLINDVEKHMREEEKRILSSILTEVKGMEAGEQIEKLPLTPASISLLATSDDPKKRKKYITKSFELGYQNEVILILIQKGSVTPELVEVVEGKNSQVNAGILSLLYASVGMFEKLEGLKARLPAPIEILITKSLEGDKECYKSLMSLMKLWECEVCGKEYSSFSPICGNCLSWNKLKAKGGS